MKLYRCWYVLLILLLGPQALAETISHGRFENLTIYRPQGEARQTVLFFSGEQGWTADLAPIAHSLARQGALVAGIDSRALFRKLDEDDDVCVSPEGDLENLSHFLQAYYRLPAYRPALLVGVSSGSSFVQAMLAQAPVGTFGGGISLGFCPRPVLKTPLCPSGKDRSDAIAPWLVLQGIGDHSCRVAAGGFLTKVKNAESITVPGDNHGEADFHTWEPQFAAAYHRLADRARTQPTAIAQELRDLPIVEVTATGSSDTLAVLISGDGGWAGIDKELAAALTKQGMPVVGLDSLRYFWKERTPQSTAADVDRILRYYLAAWNKKSAVLIGFSQGADVMPFVVNRLPAATRQRVRMVALLSLSQTAVFEFHLQNWLGGDKGEIPTEPELLRMKGIPTLCVFGEEEQDSLCNMPAAKSLQVIKLPGGHHFDGDYAGLAKLLLSRMR